MAKREVNEELNLTPFIGLFAMLVVLLLLTAVWNKIDSLSTNTSNVTAGDSSSADDQKKEVKLTVTLLDGRVEMAEDERASRLPMINGRLDRERMIAVLRQWRQRYPDKKDVVLNSENTVPYRQLIATFDILVGNDWPDVGVNTQ